MTAHLGGSDPHLREPYYKLFHLAYSLRSGLVHGSIYTPKDINQALESKGWQSGEDFLAELSMSNVLRQSLISILLNVGNGNLQNMLHTPLDKAVRQGRVFAWDK